MSETKNCGSCRWWQKWTTEMYGVRGDCTAPLPIAVLDEEDRKSTLPNQGTDCPCHAEAIPGAVAFMFNCHKTGSSISASDYREFFEWAIAQYPELRKESV